MGHAEEDQKWETNEVVNHLRPFYGLCLILPPLVWIVVDDDTFCYVILGHFKIVVKYRLNLLVQSDAFYTSNIYSWVFTIPCSLGPDLFLGFSITLFLFITFIMFVVWMFHVNPIKFPFHIVLGSPIPILAISGNLILWFI